MDHLHDFNFVYLVEVCTKSCWEIKLEGHTWWPATHELDELELPRCGGSPEVLFFWDMMRDVG
jgi:hypothetical protein